MKIKTKSTAIRNYDWDKCFYYWMLSAVKQYLAAGGLIHKNTVSRHKLLYSISLGLSFVKCSMKMSRAIMKQLTWNVMQMEMICMKIWLLLSKQDSRIIFDGLEWTLPFWGLSCHFFKKILNF
jgi:hypothetical protein